MPGPGAGVTQTVVYGGFLCIGLFLLCIATAVVLSLIPTYTPFHGQPGFGSEYDCDSIMLKFLYENSTSKFSNGTVGNCTALSDAATQEYEALGVKNFAGCLLYNGRAWDAANTSTNSRRRRRQSSASTAGMYYIGTSRVFFTTSCAKQSDRNKTENSTSLSACVKKGIVAANSLVGDIGSVFLTWKSSSRVICEVADTSGYFHSIGIDQIYGVPRNLAPAISSNLAGVTTGTMGELQRGCRYLRAVSLSDIDLILASQVSSSNTQITTMSTG